MFKSTCRLCALPRHCPIGWTQQLMTGLRWDCPFFENEELGYGGDDREAEKAINYARNHHRQRAKGNR